MLQNRLRLHIFFSLPMKGIIPFESQEKMQVVVETLHHDVGGDILDIIVYLLIKVFASLIIEAAIIKKPM